MAARLSPRFAADAASIPDSYVSGTEHLLYAQERQHRQQLKMMKNLSRRTHQEADTKAAWQQKQEREERRMRQAEAEKEEEHRVRIERHRAAQQYRRERITMAATIAEGKREAARQKVQALMKRVNEFAQERDVSKEQEAQRTSAVAARRAAAMRRNNKMQVQRRREMQHKQELAEALMKQKEELRLLEQQIRSEQEYLRENKRTAARTRSAAELAARAKLYASKSAEKDADLRRRQAAQEEMRQLRLEEARQRAEYVALHAQQAAERDEAQRAAMRSKLAQKAARSEALAAQREALAAEMANVRQQMLMQENAVRTGLERLRMSGAAFALPPDLTRTLHTEVGPGAAGVQRHLVSWRTRSSAARSPRDRHDVYSSMDDSVLPDRQRATPPLGARPMSASVSMSGGGLRDRQGTSYSFDGTASPDAAADAGGMRQGGAGAERTAAYATAAHGGRGGRLRRKGMRWDRDLPLYTTAGPIAPSSARRTELKLRQTLQDEVQTELQRQGILSKVADERERLRLTRIFAVEREMAKERILDLSSAVGLNVAAV